jgi:ATP-binding cassette subfamily B protein
MEADMIVVMNEGGITGIGTHQELLETNAEYREIWESQSGMRKGA